MDKGRLMLKPAELIYILEQKEPEESLIQGKYRLLPDRYEVKNHDQIIAELGKSHVHHVNEAAKMRLRRPSVVKTVKKTYQEQQDMPRCLACWKKVCNIVFRKLGRACLVCKTKDNLSCHHVTPREEKGATEWWNLIPLCELCHDYVECHEMKPRTQADCVRVGMGRIYDDPIEEINPDDVKM